MSSPSICGYAGFASPDNKIRLYTKSECEKLDGNYHANGECTYKSGGSISYDCREVNNDPMATLYANRYYIGGAIAVVGLISWRMMMKKA